MKEFNFTKYEDAIKIYREKNLMQALYDEGEIIMDQVLVCLHGEEHKKRRKVENKIFSREIFRLYEDNQIEEMYSLLENVTEAVDIPVSILALLAFDKLKNGDEKAAKYYFSKAKANRYSKNILAQAIYNKDIRDDAITTLDSFKY